jgi:amino acid transporter
VITVAVIVLVTALHEFDLRASRRGQNVLVAVKLTLVVGVVVVGLAAGSNGWPPWQPRHPSTGCCWRRSSTVGRC